MNAHAYALEIEYILRDVFDCDRGGFGGMIDADSIEHYFYVPIASTLGYLYAKSSATKQKEIEKYISDYNFYLDLGIKELLAFISSERVINGITYTIDYENGEKALLAVINALSSVCK